MIWSATIHNRCFASAAILPRSPQDGNHCSARDRQTRSLNRTRFLSSHHSRSAEGLLRRDVLTKYPPRVDDVCAAKAAAPYSGDRGRHDPGAHLYRSSRGARGILPVLLPVDPRFQQKNPASGGRVRGRWRGSQRGGAGRLREILGPRAALPGRKRRPPKHLRSMGLLQSGACTWPRIAWAGSTRGIVGRERAAQLLSFCGSRPRPTDILHAQASRPENTQPVLKSSPPVSSDSTPSTPADTITLFRKQVEALPS
jgi:hypothetical protein